MLRFGHDEDSLRLILHLAIAQLETTQEGAHSKAQSNRRPSDYEIRLRVGQVWTYLHRRRAAGSAAYEAETIPANQQPDSAGSN